MQTTFALATLSIGTLIGAAAAQAAVFPGAAPVSPNATPQQAERALQAVGFSQITGLRQSGNIVRAVALYQGEAVRIVLDTRTGRITDDSGAPAIDVTPSTGDAAIRAQIAALGYSGVGQVTRRGNVLTLPAQRAGDPVVVRINALTGRVSDGTTPVVQHIAARDDMDAGYVAQQLRLLGYDRVGAVTRSGNVYRADVSKAGVPATVRIDGMTGAVTR